MKNVRTKTMTTLGATALVALLAACGSGETGTSEPRLNEDGSVSVDVTDSGKVEASSLSAESIEGAYLGFWSAVAAQDFETAAGYAHPEWLEEIGEQYGYQDDPAAAVKAALYSQSYNDVWTDAEYATGWEVKHAYTSANYADTYVEGLNGAELTAEEVEIVAASARAGDDGLAKFCVDARVWEGRPAPSTLCGTVLDSDADEVLVNASNVSEVRAMNGFSQASVMTRGADGGWQFNGPIRE